MRFKARLTLATVITGIAAACGGEEGTGPTWPELPPGFVSIQYDLIEEAHTTQISGITDRRRLVIPTQEEWEAFWSEFVGNVTPAPEAPVIDFATQMVLVATMGSRNTGGYAIAVDGVFEGPTTMLVRVLESSPGSSCVTAQVLTAPATAVAFARSDLTVEFEDAAIVHECN